MSIMMSLANVSMMTGEKKIGRYYTIPQFQLIVKLKLHSGHKHLQYGHRPFRLSVICKVVRIPGLQILFMMNVIKHPLVHDFLMTFLWVCE